MNALVTAGAACALMLVSAAGASAQTMPSKPGSNPNVITISCYRGPTSGVVWDRPNAIFVEDLVRYGYTYPQAHAIGERVCRDEWGVRQPDYLRASLKQIMAEIPPSQ